MERNSLGTLCAPNVLGASGTSDPHAIISSWSLHITHVCSLAAPLTTRPPAAPAPPAPHPLFSACESVAALWRPMRVCSLAAVLRPSVLRPSAAAPLTTPAAPAPPAPPLLFSACESVAGRSSVVVVTGRGRHASLAEVPWPVDACPLAGAAGGHTAFNTGEAAFVRSLKKGNDSALLAFV